LRGSEQGFGEVGDVDHGLAKSTTTEDVLSLVTSTAQVDVTETSTITTTSTRLFSSVVPDIRRRQSACPSLASKNLVHHPASRLSRACSCLGIEPTTSTVTLGPSTAPVSTVTLTTTSIITQVVSETNILTATSVSISVVDVTTTSVCFHHLPISQSSHPSS